MKTKTKSINKKVLLVSFLVVFGAAGAYMLVGTKAAERVVTTSTFNIYDSSYMQPYPSSNLIKDVTDNLNGR